MADILDGTAYPCLLCAAGRNAGRAFVVADEATSLGRVSTNDICIRNPHVSRRHAKIVRQADGSRLIDLKSRNHTYVNGIAVHEHLLRHGDEIVIADHRYIYLSGPEDDAPARSAMQPEVLSDLERGRTVTLCLSIAQDKEPPVKGSDSPAGTPGGESMHRQMAVLREIAMTVTADDTRHSLLKRVADILIRSFDAERVFILLAGDAPGELRPAVASLRPDGDRRVLPLSRTIIEKVAGDRASFLCRDAVADVCLQQAESVVGLQLRSVMCTPLISRERLRGLIYLDNRTLPGEFTEEDLCLLTAIASPVAMMIENCEHTSRLKGEVQRLQAQVDEREPAFVGTAGTVADVLATARKAADSNATILLLGESGTGKEVLARCIHHWSERRRAPFVVVNCAALSDQLLQSDLFGHERGAFTGAVKLKQGRLELAEGGTLLLDEIGEMDQELQARLLRFLEEREFERVGGTRPIRVDVRVIAATNRDLASQVQTGGFRPDLYYRLRVVEIVMPPLRERRDDIPLLAEKFLCDYARELGREHACFSKEAIARLQDHDWPGNVRELRNAVERAVVLATEAMITAADLQLGHPAPDRRGSGHRSGYHDQIREHKRRVIEDALVAAGGVKNLAAERLGLQPSYLSRLMKNLEMR